MEVDILTLAGSYSRLLQYGSNVLFQVSAASVAGGIEMLTPNAIAMLPGRLTGAGLLCHWMQSDPATRGVSLTDVFGAVSELPAT